MKTQITKDLEVLLKRKFKSRNDFYAFECTLGWYGKEIVDCVMYNCQREVYCYEIKQSLQDFHSKNKLSFFGNKNYFVMPYNLYQQCQHEIYNEYPEVGVYVAIDHLEQKEETITNSYGAKFVRHWAEPIDGMNELYCIKPARKVELKADKEVILSSLLRSIFNETNQNIQYLNLEQENKELKDRLDRYDRILDIKKERKLIKKFNEEYSKTFVKAALDNGQKDITGALPDAEYVYKCYYEQKKILDKLNKFIKENACYDEKTKHCKCGFSNIALDKLLLIIEEYRDYVKTNR